MSQAATEKTTAAKRSYLKKLGGLNLAKEAVDLEDHREVMAINRAKLRNDMRLTIGPTGEPKLESYEVEEMDDQMRIGDDVHNHYYQPVAEAASPASPSPEFPRDDPYPELSKTRRDRQRDLYVALAKYSAAVCSRRDCLSVEPETSRQ